jgi:hypothetical protein
MGAALQWLGASGCAQVAMSILREPTTGPGVPHGFIGAHCPFHTESTPGGAFFYNVAEDVGHCYSCGQSSDLVGIYCALQGKEFEDPNAFRDFRDRYAPEHSGDRKPVEVPRPAPQPRVFTPRSPDLPPAIWSERAASFVAHAQERLQQSPEVLAQLEAWGIDAAAAKACMLGWNDKHKYPPVTSWGLPYRENKGKEAKIFLPAGLVIPWAPGRVVVKVKIRRPEPDAEPRYHHVVGGYSGYMIYGRPDAKVWVVIETERDAAMVWWHCRGLGIGAMGMGGVGMRPDARAAAILARSELILLAVDLDRAGAAQVAWWEETYPHMVRWPVPSRAGKDPGDLVKASIKPAEWVWAGVPEHVRRSLARPVTDTMPEPEAPAPSSSPAPSPAVAEPESVAELRAWLGKCSRVYAAANEQEGWGARGCGGCRKNPDACEVATEIGALVCNDRAVEGFVAAQPDGRLRK